MLPFNHRLHARLQHFTVTKLNPWYAVLLEKYHRVTMGNLPHGLNTVTREKPLVVSLTSIASRLFHKTDIAIATLLKQTCRPDFVILWLSEKLRHKPLPKSFAHLMAAGLEVRYCEDVGPHTKFIYALEAFPNGVIVTADDDVLYPANWLGELYGSYQTAPQHIHCHRAHLMRRAPDGTLLPYAEWGYRAPGIVGPSHSLFPTSGAGVLFPPGSLPIETLNVNAFRQLCPTNDDTWYTAMALLQRTLSQKVKPHSPFQLTLRGSQEEALQHINVTQNDPQIRATFTAYDLYDKF